MHRFFVPPEYINSDSVMILSDISRQISKILRMRPGNEIKVFDNSGWEYSVLLSEVSDIKVIGHISNKTLISADPSSKVILYQSLLKTDKFELILQKCTELGVAEFIPLQCARSIPRTSNQGLSKNRLSRWKKIVTEATEQSGRVHVPPIHDVLEFTDACKTVKAPALILSVSNNNNGLRNAISNHKSSSTNQPLNIFVGPEGGFTEDDINYARQFGITDISLGPRVLRAETAAIATVSATIYELGELGG